MHLAQELFAKVLQIDPGNGTAQVNLRMTRAAAKASKPTVDYLKGATERAKRAIDEGRYAFAVQQLSTLIKANATADLYLHRAEALLALRKPRQALNDGGRTLALEPGNLEAYRVMGDAHHLLARNKRAAYYYKLYLSRLPNTASHAEKRKAIQQLVEELSQP
jgi:tetratricopeptide (TPR) repeat protein